MRTLTLSLVAVSTLLAADARAQPKSAQAEVLFRKAKEAMTAKKYAEACSLFDESQKLDPVSSTMINQADCREKNGQLATAWGLFLTAERNTRSDASQAQLNSVAKG